MLRSAGRSVAPVAVHAGVPICSTLQEFMVLLKRMSTLPQYKGSQT